MFLWTVLTSVSVPTKSCSQVLLCMYKTSVYIWGKGGREGEPVQTCVCSILKSVQKRVINKIKRWTPKTVIKEAWEQSDGSRSFIQPTPFIVLLPCSRHCAGSQGWLKPQSNSQETPSLINTWTKHKSHTVDQVKCVESPVKGGYQHLSSSRASGDTLGGPCWTNLSSRDEGYWVSCKEIWST